jgi:putative aldouronate transport system substrate-binding protein
MKRISACIPIMLLLLVLAACSSKQNYVWPEAAEPQNDEASGGAAAAQALTVVFPLLQHIPEDMAMIEAEVSRIALQRIGMPVKLIGISNVNYEQQTRLMLASREKADLMVTGTIGEMDFVGQAANRQLLDMNEYLERFGQGITSSVGDFMASGRVDGATLGVPTLRDEAKGAGFAIRKDLVDKYGFDLSHISSLEDLEPILRAIRDGEEGLAPFFPSQEAINGIDFALRIPGGDPLASDYYFSGVLLDAADSEMNVVNYYETEQYATIVRLIRSWNQAGYIYPGALTNDDSACTLVRAGKIAAFLQDVKPGIEGQVSRQCATEMVVVPIAPVISHTSIVTGVMWAIPKHSKHPDKAMQFLNLMYSDSELVNLLNWGIEGTHYVKQTDGTIEYPPGVNAQNTGYGINQGFIFGNQLLSYVWKGDPVDLWEQMDEFNDSAIKSKALGFLFDPVPVKTEYAACLNVWQQYQKALGVGAVDPALVLPEFIEKLRAAGVDKVVEEKQRQLDAWAIASGIN